MRLVRFLAPFGMLKFHFFYRNDYNEVGIFVILSVNENLSLLGTWLSKRRIRFFYLSTLKNKHFCRHYVEHPLRNIELVVLMYVSSWSNVNKLIVLLMMFFNTNIELSITEDSLRWLQGSKTCPINYRASVNPCYTFMRLKIELVLSIKCLLSKDFCQLELLLWNLWITIKNDCFFLVITTN